MLNVDNAHSWSSHAFVFALFASVQSKGSAAGRLGTIVRGGHKQDLSLSARAEAHPVLLIALRV